MVIGLTELSLFIVLSVYGMGFGAVVLCRRAPENRDGLNDTLGGVCRVTAC